MTIDAWTIAENAIGLFLEDLERRGVTIPATSEVLELAKYAAVGEVDEGVNADVPSPRRGPSA